MDIDNSKIDVVLFDLELSSWHRRPKATLDFSDARISAHYHYGIGSSKSNPCEISNSKLRSLNIKADVAVIYAYRIPELLLLLCNPEVKFIYMQHGYYPDRIKRDVSGIFKKYDRIVYYISLLLRFLIKTRNITAIKEILGLWLIDNYKIKHMPSPDLCVVLDLSWIDFHKRKLGWTNSNYITKRFYEQKEILKNKDFDAQYVAQTLVEDSRLSPGALINCLNNYIRKNNIKKLCIISHPRTVKEIYKGLECKYEFEDNHCYDVETFGHYSSLLLYLAENGIHVSLASDSTLKIPIDFFNRINESSKTGSKLFSNDMADCIINGEVVKVANNHCE